jgi:hypothetical protein
MPLSATPVSSAVHVSPITSKAAPRISIALQIFKAESRNLSCDFVCKRVEKGHTFTRNPGTRSLGETIRTLKGPQGLCQDREICGRRHLLLLCLGRSWWFTGPQIARLSFTYKAIEAPEFQWVNNNFPNRG